MQSSAGYSTVLCIVYCVQYVLYCRYVLYQIVLILYYVQYSRSQYPGSGLGIGAVSRVGGCGCGFGWGWGCGWGCGWPPLLRMSVEIPIQMGWDGTGWDWIGRGIAFRGPSTAIIVQEKRRQHRSLGSREKDHPGRRGMGMARRSSAMPSVRSAWQGQRAS